jgi:hypothetical protein
MPESGTLTHHSTFDVPWLSSVGGGWERKPTAEELTTMLYDMKDIPATLEARNAEVRVYHMWDESMVGVSRNDTQRHALIFWPAAKSPPGAFGVKKYVIFNTVEGMTQPGQWYLDRRGGQLVYWPLPGEDIGKVRVIAPRLERLIHIAGNKKQLVEKITIRGLILQGTNTPLKAGGFGAFAFDGAVRIDSARGCTLEKLEICNVGGQGLLATKLADSLITECHVHHTGACGIRIEGSGTGIAHNHVHQIGVYYPSAVAVSADGRSEKGLHLYRNEIHDAPYSGIVLGGRNHLIEENLIYRVMREMQDGGAIYGGVTNCILRGNMVRDIVKMGEGYGVSSYYLDEGARDCLVERNVSVGVERPTHNHIATNTTIRNNVFISDGDMTLSFQRSRGCVVQGNTFFTPGKLTVSPPSAVTLWKDNLVFHDGLSKGGTPLAFKIDEAMPTAVEPHRISWPVAVPRTAQPPRFDGQFHLEDWPGGLVRLDREPSRWSATGAPVYAYLAYDERFLYVAVNVAMFDVSKLRTAAAWGKDDGAEFCIAGRTRDGRAVTFVIRGFAGGTVQSVADAGAPPPAAELLGKGVRFIAKPYGKNMGGWRGQWIIPLDALGLKPAPGRKVPFNLGVFRSEDQVWRCWEGTHAENWRLGQAGQLQFK